MELKPLEKNIQIKIRLKVSKSGIVISSDDVDDIADVIAVGPDVTMVKPGDVVYYKKTAGTSLETKFDRIIEEKDLLANLEE